MYGWHFRVYRVVSKLPILWATLEPARWAGKFEYKVTGVLRFQEVPQLAQRLISGQGVYNLYLRPLSGSKVLSIFLLYTICNRGKYARLGPRLQSIALKPIHSFDKHSQRICSFLVLCWALQRPMGQMQILHSGTQTAGPQDHVVKVYHSRHFT